MIVYPSLLWASSVSSCPLEARAETRGFFAPMASPFQDFMEDACLAPPCFLCGRDLEDMDAGRVYNGHAAHGSCLNSLHALQRMYKNSPGLKEP